MGCGCQRWLVVCMGAAIQGSEAARLEGQPPPCWLRSVARVEVFAVEADKLRRDRHAWVREAAFPDVADRFAGGSRLVNGEACLIH